MFEVFPWLLFLHVMAAIVAFGPTFAFSIIGAMGGREPQHANFATRTSQRIGDILVEPFAISMLVTGALMMWAAEIPILDRSTRWLLLGIVLYLVAIGLSLFVSRPAVKRIVALSGGDPDAEAGERPQAGPPPAELPSAVATVRRAGMVMTVLLVAIVFLMVMQPDFGF